MNINKAGKQQKACWRSEQHWRTHWVKENSDYQRLMNLERGFSTGWMAGVAWAKRHIMDHASTYIKNV